MTKSEPTWTDVLDACPQEYRENLLDSALKTRKIFIHVGINFTTYKVKRSLYIEYLRAIISIFRIKGVIE